MAKKKAKRVASTPTRSKTKDISKQVKRVNATAAKTPVKQTELRDAPTMAAFKQWKDEGVPVKNLVGDLKTSEFTLRMRFINIAGGRDAFDALRKSGAGGRVFGGKKFTPAAIKQHVAQNDAKVKRIKSCSSKDGWTSRRSWRAASVTVKDVGPVSWREMTALIHIAPNGQEYIVAGTNERADLIVEPAKGTAAYMQPVRLKKYEDSRAAKQQRAHERDIERGEAARKVKQKEKSKSKTQKHSAKKRR